MGSITVAETQPEQVVTGTYKGMQVIVLGVKPTKEAAQVCWEAACRLVDTGAFAGSPTLIVDILKTTVRHGYITQMEEG